MELRKINSLTFHNCTLCPRCIDLFCIYLRTNSDLCCLSRLMCYVSARRRGVTYHTCYVVLLLVVVFGSFVGDCTDCGNN
jgi:hypothetical protein